METTEGQVKKGAGGQKAGRSTNKAVSQFIKARLRFLVAHIARYLEKGRYAPCVGTSIPIYLAANVFELAGNAAHDNKKSTIILRHMMLAISLGGHCPWKGSSKHYPDAVALEVAIQVRQVSKECLESLF